MKYLLLIAFLSFGFNCYCEDIDAKITSGVNQGLTLRYVLDQRMAGLIDKAKKAEDSNLKAQADLGVIQKKDKAKDDMIDWQSGQITSLTAWGNKCEHAVKAIAELLSIVVALWIGTAFAGQILKNFPSIEGPIATAILYVLVFLFTYYAITTCIFAISSFIPTVPVWHDIAAHFTKLYAPKL